MPAYVLITKFYNEEIRLPILIQNISAQTLKPRVFVFINDGSNDNSPKVAAEEATKYGIKYEIISMPPKAKGNLDTLGRAWNKAQPRLRILLQDVPYAATTDVDTTFPTSYFENMISYMEKHPDVGVVAGQVRDQPKRTFPMFTGKVFRSIVIRNIKKYWEVSADSFINVKAFNMGYRLVILDNVTVESEPTHLHTWRGRFRQGRLAYYSGSSLSFVILKGIVRRDPQYLRGYWSERSRKIWRCHDDEVLAYYRNELKRRLVSLVKRCLRL
ncbi:MAG: glycosyltransferase family A protein [Candidatus Odinarchaeota archaeon]